MKYPEFKASDIEAMHIIKSASAEAQLYVLTFRLPYAVAMGEVGSAKELPQKRKRGPRGSYLDAMFEEDEAGLQDPGADLHGEQEQEQEE